MNFDFLVHSISDVHGQLQAQATRAINVSLTLRNWLIGGYIAEYQLRGEDRAKYGEGLFDNLARELKAKQIPNCNKSRLYRYRDFYECYPQIRESLTPVLGPLLSSGAVAQIVAMLSPLFGGPSIVATLSPLLAEGAQTTEDPTGSRISAAIPPHRSASSELQTPGRYLVERLSYSHLELLIPLDPPIKRTFYEIECIKGGWSVRELNRQIASLYFERSGLSRDKESMSRMANQVAEAQSPALIIRDPFVFDFLGIHGTEALSESALEDALMRHLQAFLLELGRGFCFEARQKRLLIGDEYYFCDLVFYHRILKCHVIVELKTAAFSHEHLGQLNTYVAWYRENEMQPGDQPPVGILLCTQQNQALVKYALAGLDQSLFVSRYQMQLPDVTELEAFMQRELKAWEASHS